jgi:hypothetical protein
MSLHQTRKLDVYCNICCKKMGQQLSLRLDEEYFELLAHKHYCKDCKRERAEDGDYL